MSKVSRALRAARTTVTDAQERRAYVARLKWLMRGSNTLEAHSIEYRRGLSGKWKIKVERLATEAEVIISCPQGCTAHAPLTHVYEARATYELRDTVVSTVSGATVITNTNEPNFFLRESITWPFESILTHGLEVPEVGQETLELHDIAIVFPTTSNYYHWLIEDLPAVLRASETAPEAKLVAFADGVTQRHELVSRAISKELVSTPALVSLEHQVLAGRADGNWFAHPEDLQRLRMFGTRLTGEEEPGGQRLYISRRLSQRPLSNEQVLEELMAASGYKVVFLEALPWEAQIALFQKAEVVVGPHGAGLSNLAFSAPGTLLVELVSGAMFNRCYEWLCHAGGYQYASIQIDGDSANDLPGGILNPQQIFDQIGSLVS